MKADAKKDYLKFFKPCLIVAVILLVLSVLTSCIFGVNKSLDFSGGTQLVVQFEFSDVDVEDDAKLVEVSKSVSKMLNDSNISINSFQTQGVFGTKSFVITFKNTNEETVNAVRVAINKEYNTSQQFAELVEQGKEAEILGKNADLTKQTTQLDGFVASTALIATISSLLFVLALLTVYGCFRFGMAGALSMAFGAVLDVALSVCLVLLCRVEINTYIFVACATVMVASILFSTELLFTIKDLAKDPNFYDLNNYELTNLAVDKNIKKTFVKTICMFVLAFVVGLLSVRGIMKLSLVVMAGLVATLATHIFVVPAFFATINKKRIKPVAKLDATAKTKTNAQVTMFEE